MKRLIRLRAARLCLLRTISSRISTQSWRYSTDPTVPIAVSVVGSIPPGNTGSAGEDAVPLAPSLGLSSSLSSEATNRP